MPKEHASRVRCPECLHESVSVWRYYAEKYRRPIGTKRGSEYDLRLEEECFEIYFTCGYCGYAWPIPDWLDPNAPLRPVSPCRLPQKPPPHDPRAVGLKSVRSTTPTTWPIGMRVVVKNADSELNGHAGAVREHGLSVVHVLIDGQRSTTAFYPNELEPELTLEDVDYAGIETRTVAATTSEPDFKVGDWVEHRGSSRGTCVARVLKLDPCGLLRGQLLVDGALNWVPMTMSRGRCNKIDPPRHSGWTRDLEGDQRIVPGATVLLCEPRLELGVGPWSDEYIGEVATVAKIEGPGGSFYHGAILRTVWCALSDLGHVYWPARDCIFICGPDEQEG